MWLNFFLRNKGLFLLVTIAFWKGHSVARYVRSLAPLTPLTRSAALRFATLASLARSVHELAHSLCSLPHGMVKIHESVFMLRSRSKGTNAFVVVTRNTPLDNRKSSSSIVIWCYNPPSCSCPIIKSIWLSNSSSKQLVSLDKPVVCCVCIKLVCELYIESFILGDILTTRLVVK